ncbi:hypothetical protein M0811_02485 [Anaeramoeba ignava]|uniref:TLDc domain-containing protein n=1 Tax=Anaeramoeba ignava TaxID=1746090 RepID=A0A9Q0LBI2_ANAIG|nr:hypothetical protein M0811_02485 [Anaeramoeba ignava]
MNNNRNQQETDYEQSVTKNLKQDYSNILSNESFTDYSIFVENKSNSFEIKVHKSILSSRSPFFNENERLKLKKDEHKMNAKKRLFHSFFSLFDKDSISKQDFDKLKQFQIFLPKSFLVDIQNKVIQENKNQEKKINLKRKENHNLKKEIEEKWKKEVEDMKPIFDKYRDQYQKDLEYEQQMKAFSDSEIVQDIEYVKKLQEWINDNDFFSKMKKGFSAKKDGFNSQNWHSKVDWKGKTLVIIKTKDNFIFGGFTQVGFKNSTSEENINDSNAFIFSLRNDKGDRIPAKFTYNGKGRAICSSLRYGPLFGGGNDFYLNSNLQPGYSNFGFSYNLPNGITHQSNEAKNYLAGSYNKWIVDELETYFI